jgi:hypothetical protein
VDNTRCPAPPAIRRLINEGIAESAHWGRAGFRAPRNELNVCVRPSERNPGALQAGNGRTSLVLALTGCKPSGPQDSGTGET